MNMNSSPNWEKTGDERLIYIIKNPARFRPEEFMGALHQYSIKHGPFTRVRDNFEALVNAYIAFNPDYKKQSAGDIFVWAGKSRGVPSFKSFDIKPPYDMDFDGDSLQMDDYVYEILDQIEEKIHPLQFVEDGLYDNGSSYIVYFAGYDIRLTVSTDENWARYIIANVVSADAMQNFMEVVTRIFPQRIPSLEGSFEAEFHDTEKMYIKDDMPDYFCIITVSGSQLFVEEVMAESGIIRQKQFCTPEFFEACNAALGPRWGFAASWMNKEQGEEKSGV
jgi:hypothetical protein